MIENINFKLFNIPSSVQEKIIDSMVKKTSELITLKASFTSELVDKINSKSPSMADGFWNEHQIAFLQQGTTKEEILLFSKQILLTMFNFVFKELMENIEEDVAQK
jgi:hypothetical protein